MMSPAMIEWVGALAAVLTTSAFLPQAIRTIRTRQTRDISLWTQWLLFIGNLMWLGYGVFLGSLPLILANCVSVPLIAVVLVLKLRHG
jgi:MtN3 and saliva related transmembrane protein